MVPKFEISRSSEAWEFEGWDGVRAEYKNPAIENIRKPIDASEYQLEWDELKRGKSPRNGEVDRNHQDFHIHIADLS